MPLEVANGVLQMFKVEVPDNVVALEALVATSLLPADLLMRAEVELNVVYLNINAATSGKAMSEQVGAQMQEMDSWKRLHFKPIAEKFACCEPCSVNRVTMMSRRMNQVQLFMCRDVLKLPLFRYCTLAACIVKILTRLGFVVVRQRLRGVHKVVLYVQQYFLSKLSGS